MKEAEFWRTENGKVRCSLCPRRCLIARGRTGFCSARRNVGGKLFSAVYGKPCAVNVDPIEKKPLNHFAPGTACLSLATVGCNLDCAFCQNSEISHPSHPQGEAAVEDLLPEDVVGLAQRLGVPGIAYTYTEPAVFFEYALDTMKLARRRGLFNVWVSNGYISHEPARKAAKLMDAINVDLKGDAAFYRDVCGVPDESPIREALRIYRKAGVWIEVTNLLIPGRNDGKAQVKALAEWVRDNLGKGTPLHFSRFHPMFRMKDVPATPLKSLETAWSIATKAGMEYVYIGNWPGHPRENTYCPRCGALVAERSGHGTGWFTAACQKCGAPIPLAGEKWIMPPEPARTLPESDEES
jgi:pyruvate formate lyase activating enzyme